MSYSELQQAAAQELLSRRRARASLLDFTLYTKPGYSVNWHHQVLCRYLDRFARGEVKFQMIFVPPQHGKSELASRKLPPFILGRYPDAKVIAASYAATLIQGMNRDVQRTIDSAEYARLFPDTTLNNRNIRTVSGSWLRNNDEFEIVGRRGSYKCGGVGGSFTGNPCDFGLIDDPFKGYAEAFSKTIRESTWEWYISDFLSRTNINSHILLLMTRWHPDDLAGRLLKLEGDRRNGGLWDVLRLPAICEDPDAPDEQRQIGEALWPERFPLSVFEQRRRLNPHQFRALYQQDPRPKEGRLFQDATFYDELPNTGQFGVGIDLAYTASTRANYSALVVRMQAGDKTYIVEVDRWQEGINHSITRLRKWQRQHNVLFHVEANGPQKAVADTLESAGIRIVRHQPVGDKYARAQEFADAWNAGNVLVPRQRFDEKGVAVYPWLDDYLGEIAEFTGINDAVDDQVDASVIGFASRTPQVFNVRKL